MARIRVEQPHQSLNIELRVATSVSALDNPHVHIRWLNHNKSLGDGGWGNEPTPLAVGQRREGNDLVLLLEQRHASHIKQGTLVEIEIPGLGITEQLFWLAPGSEIGKPQEKEVTPPAPPSSRSPPTPPPKIETKDPTGGFFETVIEKKIQENIKAEPEKVPKTPLVQPPPPPPIVPSSGRYLWVAGLATVVAFLLGSLSGSGGIFYYYGLHECVRVGPNSCVRQCPAIPDTSELAERAYAPLKLGVSRLPDKSPRGLLLNTVVAPTDAQRATKYYDQGRRSVSTVNGAEVFTEESVYWFRQSVNACYSRGLFGLGRAYWNKEGVTDADKLTGFQLLRLGAALGSTEARDFIVKDILGTGQLSGVPENLSLSSRYQSARP